MFVHVFKPELISQNYIDTPNNDQVQMFRRHQLLTAVKHQLFKISYMLSIQLQIKDWEAFFAQQDIRPLKT